MMNSRLYGLCLSSAVYLWSCSAVSALAEPSPTELPLYDNLGTHYFTITTSSPQAQKYFNQGLRLTYGFNHEEAGMAYKEAARHDPSCAMCYWGIALVLGPNINLPMDAANEPAALEAARKAVSLSKSVTDKERALIEALAKRYGKDANQERAARDQAYASAMSQVAARFPDDPDIQALFAESMMDLRPWDYWTSNGEPKPGTDQVVAALEQALKVNPNHPGACHYYIHAVEASTQPERGLDCARKLPTLMPGAGHLVHMPAHIYMRLGMYEDAIAANQTAAHVDHNYIQDRKPQGFYPMAYYPHNLHFLYAASAMAGRSNEAILAARELVEKVPPEAVSEIPPLELFTPTPYFALARFGKWEEILNESAPPVNWKYTTAIWHYARGLAYNAMNEPGSATKEKNQLRAIRLEMGEDVVIGLNQGKKLLELADLVLSAEIAAREGHVETAKNMLNDAIQLEATLVYDEPPAWYQPVRQVLGAIMLSAKRPAEAEKLYREDLQRNPNNGWSLFGLVESLKAQDKITELATMEQRFRSAWRKADVSLSASKF